MFKMTMSDKVVRLTGELCKQYPDKEWSGFLFTKTNLEDKTIEALDYLNMNVGSAAYTEFEMSPELPAYMIENNLLEDGIGIDLCHSHNKMSCFFSGTDLSTFTQEALERTQFISVIVNNAGEFKGLISYGNRLVEEIELTNDLHGAWKELELM